MPDDDSSRFRWSPSAISVDAECAREIAGADWELGFEEWKRVLQTLQDLAGLTWREVLQLTAGEHKRNHSQSVGDLHPAAQAVYADRDVEVAFRVRVDGAGRIWGQRDRAVFYPIIYDRDHKVYEVAKRNT
ncbi:MAG: hypothetical protein LBU05_06040 [Bifidobacteriaceae bacterium]|nr:hypothetical protein [Bifidobacteriaceae bacterium]